jgi:hypothetical protein
MNTMQILVFTAFNVLCKLKKHTTCDIYTERKP